MKETRKKKLYVMGKLSGDVATKALIVTIVTYFIGWVSFLALDLEERREMKKKLNKNKSSK